MSERVPVLITLPTPNLCACACGNNHHDILGICTFAGTVAAHSNSILLMCEPCKVATSGSDVREGD